MNKESKKPKAIVFLRSGIKIFTPMSCEEIIEEFTGSLMWIEDVDGVGGYITRDSIDILRPISELNEV